ncbi:hypothetical protein B9Z19DRAFT_1128272 [Tuber borchii]|uniref:Uncharacterized protein n=1 Tax=Tuber borchii TaxID=42251 RepID=A0A2T6ZPR7_TUBBO|nr:hypothetical protein B9Z19DRAFT_1128272 [Tuber borchii]
MSFYETQPPCAQDASFYSAFTMNPPAALPAHHWPSLSNWVAHQKQVWLKEQKRQLAYQLCRIIDVEDLRAAALRKMHIEEEEWGGQQQQQQQSNEFDGFSYNSAQISEENFSLDARHDQPMHTSFHNMPPHPFVAYTQNDENFASRPLCGKQAYRDDTFANERVQVDVEEECYSNGQKLQDCVLDHTRLMSTSGTAKAQAVERMNGLAAYVAELKAQMAEKMNSGDFTMDASTARGYEQYTRTPEFFRARRNERSQNRLSSAEHSQVEILEGSREQTLTHSTSSGDSGTPDLYVSSQTQSVDSVNSFECSPDEPIFRSPDGPALKIFAPQPAPPRPAILQMASDETVEESYLCYGYGVDGAEALHWQLPDWLWYHKSQQAGVEAGISYDFNYPPCGYAATPEFVELHYAGELDHPASAEHRYEMEPVEEEEISEDGSSPRLTPSEYRRGCTPRYFIDSQSQLGYNVSVPSPHINGSFPSVPKQSEGVIGDHHEQGQAAEMYTDGECFPQNGWGGMRDFLPTGKQSEGEPDGQWGFGAHEMSTLPGPMADPHEILRARIHGIPPVYKRGPILPPTDILEPSIFEPFVYEPATCLNIIGKEAFMTNKASKPADLSPTVCGSPPRATPQRQEPRRTENFSSSLTPPNRFRHPVDSDPLTPESPVFRKSTFPDSGQFVVHNTNNEHLFTPSPRKPGSSPPRFALHTRKSNRKKNRGEVKPQSIEAIEARRAAVSAYLEIQPSEWPIIPEWPTPGPETPLQSSPFPYSVDTPSPSVLVHKRHLKNRRAKLLPAKQPAMPAQEEPRPVYANAQHYWH